MTDVIECLQLFTPKKGGVQENIDEPELVFNSMTTRGNVFQFGGDKVCLLQQCLQLGGMKVQPFKFRKPNFIYYTLDQEKYG